jgi:hypothetical protein
VFEGRGFGHGVGLCQAGAFARIMAGGKPAAVLARYYPGTRSIVGPTFRSGVHESDVTPELEVGPTRVNSSSRTRRY